MNIEKEIATIIIIIIGPFLFAIKAIPYARNSRRESLLNVLRLSIRNILSILLL